VSRPLPERVEVRPLGAYGLVAVAIRTPEGWRIEGTGLTEPAAFSVAAARERTARADQSSD
jgi:hypothetical protein